MTEVADERLTDRKLKRLYFSIVGLAGFSIILNQCVFRFVHYCVGRGSLDAILIFPAAVAAIPTIPTFLTLVAWLLSRKWRIEVQLRWIALGWLAALLFVIVARPGWRTGDEYICRGLAASIEEDSTAGNLVEFVNKLAAQNLTNINSAPQDVTVQAPASLKGIFGRARMKATYHNWESNKYVLATTGGHDLQYGLYIGDKITNLPALSDSRIVTLGVRSNIIAFAR